MSNASKEERWIIAVRQCVTNADPHITVGEIYQIFAHDSEQTDLLCEQFHKGHAPEQAFVALKRKFGQRLGVTRYDADGNPQDAQSGDRARRRVRRRGCA